MEDPLAEKNVTLLDIAEENATNSVDLDEDCDNNEEFLEAQVVYVGGDYAAGEWAKALPDSANALILSHLPQGVFPYEHTALLGDLIDPESSQAGNIFTLPYVHGMQDQEEEGVIPPYHQIEEWYRNRGISFVWDCDLRSISTDLEGHSLTVQLEPRCQYVNGDPVDSKIVRVKFERLIIGTPPQLPPDPIDWTSRHRDVLIDRSSGAVTFKDDKLYGFGSVHCLGDFIDAFKLVKGVMRAEDDGQETCFDPVCVVGEGIRVMQVVSMLNQFLPDLPVVVVSTGEGCMADMLGGNPIDDLRVFYERQMTLNNVKLVRGYEVERLWLPAEEGEFVTLEGPATGMQPTRPRPFGKCQPQFVQSRGVVLVDPETEQRVHLATRLTVCLPSTVPDTVAFSDCELRLHGEEPVNAGLCVDRHCLAHPHVFAVGACAAFPIRTDQGDDDPEEWRDIVTDPLSTILMVRYVAAHCTVEEDGSWEPFEYIPERAGAMFDVSCRTVGHMIGEAVRVGDTHGRPKFFACVWVKNLRIVSIFLEGGTEQQIHSLKTIAREEPRIVSVKKLRKVSLERLLTNPHCLTPPKLGVGEFVAELDDDAVNEALMMFDGSGTGHVKSSQLGELMRELGADWDQDELDEAEQALDPLGKGSVHFDTFKQWWMN